jgi:hypothetical protein
MARLESDQPNEFGVDVAGAGDVNGDGYDDLIVAAVGHTAGEPREGAALVFLGSASRIGHGGPGTAAARIETDQADAQLASVAGAGDVNGDGYDDVIVGASLYDGLGTDSDSGAAFIFLGGPSGIAGGGPSAAATRLDSDRWWAAFGAAVSGAGDANGDGYDDVIVGAPRRWSSPDLNGAAFVFPGSASGIADAGAGAAATFLHGGSWLDADSAFGFGASVAGAGDIDGDGYADVIVGAPFTSETGQPGEGAALVFLGSQHGIAGGGPGAAAARFESNRRNALLGTRVAGVGDVNGDGHHDVSAGAPGSHPGGAAFVFLGERDGDFLGPPNSPDNCSWRTNPSQLDSDADGFGNSCDADFDQDGVASMMDFSVFRRCYGRPVPASDGPVADPTCAESDMDGNGVVGIGDFGLLKSEFSTPPGP